jgi:CheY-like chemotaxis protein
LNLSPFAISIDKPLRLTGEKGPNKVVQSSMHRQQTKQIGRSVAVVDDERDLVQVISILVKRLGFDVECTASDGDEIVRAVKSGKHPDVIIMDYRLPGMNGLQAAEILKQMLSDVKIVIISADDSMREATLSAGLLFLPKPFGASSLEAMLQSS